MSEWEENPMVLQYTEPEEDDEELWLEKADMDYERNRDEE